MADAAVEQGEPVRPPLLVFVHIPKTAGTTLTSILTTNEPGPRTRHGGNVFKGSGGVKQGVKFENLLRNANGELDRARVLTGHFPLGIREHLPKDRDVRYMTILREPADRTLSHYFQIRERFGEGARKLGLAPLAEEATLDDALAGGYLHDNVQTRMLSGQPEPFGEVDDEMLEQAKHSLSHELTVFGLTERFDETLVLAKQRLGLRGILYPRSDGSGRASGRFNPTRPRGGDVPGELLDAARRCNRYDIELYRHAQELFDQAPERGQLEFDVELAALRRALAGDADASEPPSAGFDGGDGAWRMLVDTRAESQRLWLRIAKLEAVAEELSRRDQEVLALLEKIQADGTSSAGRDAETATRLLRMLAPGRAKAPAEGAAERPVVSKRRRSATRAVVGGPHPDRNGRKPRNRSARKPRNA